MVKRVYIAAGLNEERHHVLLGNCRGSMNHVPAVCQKEVVLYADFLEILRSFKVAQHHRLHDRVLLVSCPLDFRAVLDEHLNNVDVLRFNRVV